MRLRQPGPQPRVVVVVVVVAAEAVEGLLPPTVQTPSKTPGMAQVEEVNLVAVEAKAKALRDARDHKMPTRLATVPGPPLLRR